MNNKELEKRIHKAKRESERFFSPANFRMTLQHIKNGIDKKRRKVGVFSPFKLRIAAACLVLALVMSLVVFMPGNEEHIKKAVSTENLLEEQTVPLKNSKDEYIVSFYLVNIPNVKDPSLMGVLWKIDDKGSEMIYYSIFEQCSEPYPVSTVMFTDTDPELILISSGDTDREYIHYRLIGYDNDTIYTFWSQDYVSGGELGIRSGMIVEKRDAVGDGYEPVVTYIIPYETLDSGELRFPVGALRVKVGERILLVGNDSQTRLTGTSKNGLVNISDDADKNAMSVYTREKGEDILSVYPENRNDDVRYIHLDILD